MRSPPSTTRGTEDAAVTVNPARENPDSRRRKARGLHAFSLHCLHRAPPSGRSGMSPNWRRPSAGAEEEMHSSAMKGVRTPV